MIRLKGVEILSPVPSSLTIISGPSGAGKATVIRDVLPAMPDLQWSVSATTRPPRPGEVNGVDYHFLTEAEFFSWLERGDLLEHAAYGGYFYGTPRPPAGRHVLVECDVQGATKIREAYSGALLIWLTPPGGFRWIRLIVLAVRLRHRGTETPRVIIKRLRIAWGEMRVGPKAYDHVVVNRNSARSAIKVCRIIAAHTR